MRRARLIALGAAVCGAAPTALAAQAEVLRIGAGTTETFGEAYFALENGAFKDAGFDVAVQPFPNGATTAAAAAGGAIDVGIGEATELANGVARGLPFAAFAGAALYTSDAPTTLLCVAKTSAIASPPDLEGRIVAVPALVSLSSTAVKAWLVQGGADLAKVKFVELPIPQMGPAIVRGTIAAAHIGEPSLSAAVDIKPIAKPYDAVGNQFLISDWFTTRDWLARNRAAARRLTDAIYQTARWANDHHDLSAPIIARVAKLDPDRVRSMRRTRFATALDANLVQPVLDAAALYKALVRPMRAEELIVKV